jgi:hypothetical protein
MESTGDYWKGVYWLLEALGFECWLVNARGLKNVGDRGWRAVSRHGCAIDVASALDGDVAASGAVDVRWCWPGHSGAVDGASGGIRAGPAYRRRRCGTGTRRLGCRIGCPGRAPTWPRPHIPRTARWSSTRWARIWGRRTGKPSTTKKVVPHAMNMSAACAWSAPPCRVVNVGQQAVRAFTYLGEAVISG